jgi:hypothetical protein
MDRGQRNRNRPVYYIIHVCKLNCPLAIYVFLTYDDSVENKNRIQYNILIYVGTSGMRVQAIDLLKAIFN